MRHQRQNVFVRSRDRGQKSQKLADVLTVENEGKWFQVQRRSTGSLCVGMVAQIGPHWFTFITQYGNRLRDGDVSVFQDYEIVRRLNAEVTLTEVSS